MSGGSYTEARVPGASFDAVWQVRFRAPVQDWLVLPDGVVDLVLVPGAPASVVGAATRATSHAAAAGSCTVGLRLRPGAVPAVLGVRAEDLRDRVVALGDLDTALAGGTVARAWEAVQAGRAEDAAMLLREAALACDEAADPIVARAAATLRADPSTTVAALADLVGYSPRQLRRRFAEHVGYGPKRFARVMRLQRFLVLERAWPEASVGRLAAAAGFADHAHLVDECRALASRTPAQLRAQRGATLVIEA